MKKMILIFIILFAGLIKVNALSSYVVMDASSGRILGGENIDSADLIASTTKIMTAIVAIENFDASKIICAGDEIDEAYGSMIYIKKNECMTLYDLLVGLMLRSGNDAALMIAKYVSGSVPDFVDKMNEKAKELGCKNTNFVNVHGLDDDNHLTTARDMSIMARELLKHEEILNYTSIYEEFLNKPDGTRTWMVNTNKLIKYYNGLDGLKTGFTKKAGYCLTATAKRNGMRLISVVMNEATTEDRSNDTIKLMNHGFANYKIKVIMEKDKNLGEVKVLNGKKEYVNLKLISDATSLEEINDDKKYSFNILVKPIKAPVKVGDIIGQMQILEGGIEKESLPITVMESIKKANIWDLYKRNLNKILIGA